MSFYKLMFFYRKIAVLSLVDSEEDYYEEEVEFIDQCFPDNFNSPYDWSRIYIGLGSGISHLDGARARWVSCN